MKRIYISGPMSGLPEKNFPAFNAEAARLRALGYEVVNPVEINGYAAVNEGRSHRDCLRNDVAGLATCDTLAMLPLPPDLFSKGMDIEIKVADLLEIIVVHAHTITEPCERPAAPPLRTYYTQAACDAEAMKLGYVMVEMTTTVRYPDEWAAIPDLWKQCMEERDRYRRRLRVLTGSGPITFVQESRPGSGNWRLYRDTRTHDFDGYAFTATTGNYWPNVLRCLDVAIDGDDNKPIGEPDLIARGMTWELTTKLMKEACAQAGVKWGDDEPSGRAVNIMQRLANSAHREGFKLALERVGMSQPYNGPLKKADTPVVDEAKVHLGKEQS